jgi:hypothetical protein
VAALARLCRHAPMAFSGETKAMKYFTHVDSPLGTMLLVSNGSSLTGLYFDRTEIRCTALGGLDSE